MVSAVAMAAVKDEIMMMLANIHTMATMRPPKVCGALSP